MGKLTLEVGYELVKGKLYQLSEYDLSPVQVEYKLDYDQTEKGYSYEYISNSYEIKLLLYFNLKLLTWFNIIYHYDEFKYISNVISTDIYIPFVYHVNDLLELYHNNFTLTLTSTQNPLFKVQELRYIYSLFSPNREYRDEWFEKRYQRFKNIKFKSTVTREGNDLKIKVIDDNNYPYLLRKLGLPNDHEILFQFDQRERGNIDFQNLIIEEQLKRINLDIVFELKIPKERVVHQYKLKPYKLRIPKGEGDTIFVFLHVFNGYGNLSKLIIYPIDFNIKKIDYITFDTDILNLLEIINLLYSYKDNVDIDMLKKNYKKIIISDLSELPETEIFYYDNNIYTIENVSSVYLLDRTMNILQHGDEQYKNLIIPQSIIVKKKTTSNLFNTNFFRKLKVNDEYHNFKNSTGIRLF